MRVILKNRFNIGIILLLLTTSITNLMAYIMNKNMSIFSDIFLIICLICLIDIKSLKNFRIYIYKLPVILFIYMIVLIIFSIKASYSFNNELGSIIYLLYAIVLLIIIFTNKEWNEINNFSKILFYISGILSVIATYVISNHFSNIFNSINIVYDNKGTLIANRLTISNIALISFVSCFSYTNKNKFEYILKIIFLVFSTLLMLMVNRRGSTVEIVIGILVLTIHKSNFFNNFFLKKFKIRNFFSIILAIISIAILFNNTELKTKINNFGQSINKAVITLIYNKDKNGTRDSAASTRYSLRNNIIEDFKTFNVFELFFGKGYMHKNQIDFPLLQIFYDCGIIIGMVFFILVIMYPLKFIILRPKNDMDNIMLFFAVINICNSFFTGNPYGINCYMYLIILIFYEYHKKQKIINCYEEKRGVFLYDKDTIY